MTLHFRNQVCSVISLMCCFFIPLMSLMYFCFVLNLYGVLPSSQFWRLKISSFWFCLWITTSQYLWHILNWTWNNTTWADKHWVLCQIFFISVLIKPSDIHNGLPGRERSWKIGQVSCLYWVLIKSLVSFIGSGCEAGSLRHNRALGNYLVK